MDKLSKPYFVTKVITIVGGEKYQYFHHHQYLHQLFVNDAGNGCLVINTDELDGKIASYPLTSVERFETERRG